MIYIHAYSFGCRLQVEFAFRFIKFGLGNMWTSLNSGWGSVLDPQGDGRSAQWQPRDPSRIIALFIVNLLFQDVCTLTQLPRRLLPFRMNAAVFFAMCLDPVVKRSL